MADFTYDGSTIFDLATGKPAAAGTQIQFRATPAGAAVPVYDLVSGAPIQLVASPLSSYSPFGANIDEGWLVAGDGPPTHVLSNELERPDVSGIVTAAVADAVPAAIGDALEQVSQVVGGPAPRWWHRTVAEGFPTAGDGAQDGDMLVLEP